MQPSRTERLNDIVSALNEYINVVRGYDMEETAVLLGMAKLDLQMKIHSISDQEFHALCDALEIRQPGVQDGGESGFPFGAGHANDHGAQILTLPVAAPGDGIDLRRRRAPVPNRRSGRTARRLRKS